MHKSVVASLILTGADPVWLEPRWDEENQIAHPAATDDVPRPWTPPRHRRPADDHPTEYGADADVKGIAALLDAAVDRADRLRAAAAAIDALAQSPPSEDKPMPRIPPLQ